MSKLTKRMPLFESVGAECGNNGQEFVQGLTEAGKLPAEDKDFLSGLFGGEHGNEMRELSTDDRSKLGVIFGKIREEEDMEIPAEAEAMLEAPEENILTESAAGLALDGVSMKLSAFIEEMERTGDFPADQLSKLKGALGTINTVNKEIH